MQNNIIILALMTLLALPSTAQIDLHSHAVKQSYIDYIKANGAEMDEGFPIPSWDAEKHIAFMDKAGIQTAVLTMPAPQPFFGDATASAAVCRKYNEECAALKARYPGRFMFCAALPLPDVPHALEEARYALEVLGADGIKLATNSYGQYLGDPALDTLMAYLDAQKAVVILHPHKPSAVNAQLIADVPLASYEYLAETSRAILNMIAHNVLVCYPNLKVVVPHCGSFLPNALPRFRSLLPVMVKQGIMQPVDVDANLSHLYYDLAGAPTDDVLDALLTITTPDISSTAATTLTWPSRCSSAASRPWRGVSPRTDWTRRTSSPTTPAGCSVRTCHFAPMASASSVSQKSRWCRNFWKSIWLTPRKSGKPR